MLCLVYHIFHYSNDDADDDDDDTDDILIWSLIFASCARGDTIRLLLLLEVDNIFAFIRQVAPVPEYWLFKTFYLFLLFYLIFKTSLQYSEIIQ